jgi:hypothetical protein
VYLDDFPAGVGRIPQCGQYFSTLRSRDCRLTVAMQTTDQLHQFFDAGEARAIRAAFSTKIFVPPVDTPDAEFASQLSGTTTVSIPRKQRRRTGTPVGRPLLTPDEIRLPPDHFFYGRACVAFLPNTPPVYLWAAPIHDTMEWGPTLNRLARSVRRTVLRDEPLSYTPPGPSSRHLPTLVVGGTIVTDTRGWSGLQLASRLADVKRLIHWDAAPEDAKKWWQRYETDTEARPADAVWLAEEIAARNSTLAEFHRATRVTNTEAPDAVLDYMDYVRKKEDRRKKDAAVAATVTAKPGAK